MPSFVHDELSNLSQFELVQSVVYPLQIKLDKSPKRRGPRLFLETSWKQSELSFAIEQSYAKQFPSVFGIAACCNFQLALLIPAKYIPKKKTGLSLHLMLLDKTR